MHMVCNAHASGTTGREPHRTLDSGRSAQVPRRLKTHPQHVRTSECVCGRTLCRRDNSGACAFPAGQTIPGPGEASGLRPAAGARHPPGAAQAPEPGRRRGPRGAGASRTRAGGVGREPGAWRAPRALARPPRRGAAGAVGLVQRSAPRLGRSASPSEARGVRVLFPGPAASPPRCGLRAAMLSR
ncbi:Triple Functional Domain Protein [Manis pentadactyla]|nr:Triple Functional Domain Protein [Manis pentadactyla]